MPLVFGDFFCCEHSAAAAAASAAVVAAAAAAATAAAAAADTASPGARVHPAVRALGLAYALVQLVLPLRPLLVARFDALDVVHTKSHSLLSWRMMAVTTRNFINATLYSEAMGATLVLTRTYNRLYLLHENGTRTPLPTLPNISLSPRQMGYMPYSATMVSQYARDAARAHGCSRKTGCKLVGDLWSGINGRPLQRFVDPICSSVALESVCTNLGP